MKEQYAVGQIVEWYASKAGRVAKVEAKYVGSVPLPDGQRPPLVDSKLWVYQTPHEFPRASNEGWYTVTVGGEFHGTVLEAEEAATMWFINEAAILEMRKKSLVRDLERVSERER
jgi:hypothetical protein